MTPQSNSQTRPIELFESYLNREGVKVRSIYLLLFGFGFLSAILFCHLIPEFTRIQDRVETLNVAKTLATTGKFANPFGAIATGETAHVAPVFPALAAALFKVPIPWKDSLVILAAILNGLICASLPKVSQEILGGRAPGVLAGVLHGISIVVFPQQEVLLTAMLTIWATWTLFAGSGLAWLASGLAVLANPVSVLPLGVIAAGLRRKAMISIVAGFSAICLPWVIRNWIVLGSPAPVRDNLGLELFIGNNNCAAPSFFENMESGCLKSIHPTWSKSEAIRVRQEGEVLYNREKFRIAMSWIQLHPKRFAWLTLWRAKEFFFPGWDVAFAWEAPMWIVTGIALLSAWFLPTFRIKLLLLAAFSSWLPYILVESDLRYRDATLWIWTLIAGFGISVVVKKYEQHQHREMERVAQES